MAITITPISPVAVSVFGFDIRWYALAYIAGFVICFWLIMRMLRDKNAELVLDKRQSDDFMTAMILGVVLGGRLGYVLFYNLPFFIAHPLEIFAVWHGGMSFHGGLIGAVVANFIFAHRAHVNGWRMLDLVSVVAPIGLFFGRIANFINMEVMGRPTDAPWGVVFRGKTEIPVHPSPLYEATLEGVFLFALMMLLYKKTNLRTHPGALCGVFACAYAAIRVFCELFRAPDSQIGFLTSWGLTMGQLLSALLFIAGGAIFITAKRAKNQEK